MKGRKRGLGLGGFLYIPLSYKCMWMKWVDTGSTMTTV